MSDALFWPHRRKSDDPFLEARLPAAFYRPSLPRPLENLGESEIKLSPRKLPPAGEEKENEEVNQLTPQEKAFMGRTNTILAKEMPTRDTPSPPDTSSKFNESWPSSERPSTLVESPAESSARERENTVSSRAGSNGGEESFDFSSLLLMQKGAASSEQGPSSSCQQPGPKHDSVLARYIHRFRSAAPQSRKERASPGLGKDLWWMSPPTRDTSSTSVDSRPSYRPHSRIPHAEPTGSRDTSSSSHSTSSRVHSDKPVPSSRRVPGGVPLVGTLRSRGHVTSEAGTDPETTILQEKARRLLELSESSLLSEPAVSSEGVGTSSPSLSSSDNKVYVPPEISPIRGADHRPYLLRQLGPISSRAPKPQRPEDDILYQWRLRRKMELAQKPGELSNQPPDSSLEAFRSRIHQSKPPTKLAPPRSGKDRIQFVKTTGTNLIPQAVSTQTCPRGRNAQHLGGEHLRGRQAESDIEVCTNGSSEIGGRRISTRSGSVGASYADSCTRGGRSMNAREESDGGHNKQTRSGGQDKPIAPRPVRSRSRGPPGDVPPHYHMSCDIVPCLHGDRLHEHDEDNLRERLLYEVEGETADERTMDDGGSNSATNRRGFPDRGSEFGHLQERDQGDRKGRVKQGEHGFWPGHSRSMDERGGHGAATNGRGYHDRYLHEKAQDDRKERAKGDHGFQPEGSRHSEANSDRGGHSEQYLGKDARGKDGIRYGPREGHRLADGGRLGTVTGRGVSSDGRTQSQIGTTDTQRYDEIDRRKRTEADYDEEGEGEDDILPGARMREKSSERGVKSPQRVGNSGGRKMAGTDFGADSSLEVEGTARGEVSPAGSSDTEPFTDVSSEEVEANMASKRPPMGPQEVVRSAVSRVVTKTVFGQDSPSVVTAPPSRITAAGLPQGHDPARESVSGSPVRDEGSQSASSDGEEFTDDELLQMLRRKRALYENQLRHIDDLISAKHRL